MSTSTEPERGWMGGNWDQYLSPSTQTLREAAMYNPGDWSLEYELLTRTRTFDVGGDLLFVEECLGDDWDLLKNSTKPLRTTS